MGMLIEIVDIIILLGAIVGVLYLIGLTPQIMIGYVGNSLQLFIDATIKATVGIVKSIICIIPVVNLAC